MLNNRVISATAKLTVIVSVVHFVSAGHSIDALNSFARLFESFISIPQLFVCIHSVCFGALVVYFIVGLIVKKKNGDGQRTCRRNSVENIRKRDYRQERSNHIDCWS